MLTNVNFISNNIQYFSQKSNIIKIRYYILILNNAIFYSIPIITHYIKLLLLFKSLIMFSYSLINSLFSSFFFAIFSVKNDS